MSECRLAVHVMGNVDACTVVRDSLMFAPKAAGAHAKSPGSSKEIEGDQEHASPRMAALLALHATTGALVPPVQRSPTPAQGAAAQGFVQQFQSTIAIAALAGALSGAAVPPAFAKASVTRPTLFCLLP